MLENEIKIAIKFFDQEKICENQVKNFLDEASKNLTNKLWDHVEYSIISILKILKPLNIPELERLIRKTQI